MKMLHLESFIHFFPNKYFIATYPQVHLEGGTFLRAASGWERKRRDPSFALADNCPPRGTGEGLDSPPPLWAWGLEGRTLPGLCEPLVRHSYLTVQTQPFHSDIYQLCSEPKQRGGFPSPPQAQSSGSGCSARPSPAGALGTCGLPARVQRLILSPSQPSVPELFLGRRIAVVFGNPQTPRTSLILSGTYVVIGVVLWPSLLGSQFLFQLLADGR